MKKEINFEEFKKVNGGSKCGWPNGWDVSKGKKPVGWPNGWDVATCDPPCQAGVRV